MRPPSRTKLALHRLYLTAFWIALMLGVVSTLTVTTTEIQAAVAVRRAENCVRPWRGALLLGSADQSVVERACNVTITKVGSSLIIVADDAWGGRNSEYVTAGDRMGSIALSFFAFVPLVLLVVAQRWARWVFGEPRKRSPQQNWTPPDPTAVGEEAGNKTSAWAERVLRDKRPQA